MDVRAAFPTIFGVAFGDNLAYVNDGRLAPGAMVHNLPFGRARLSAYYLGTW